MRVMEIEENRRGLSEERKMEPLWEKVRECEDIKHDGLMRVSVLLFDIERYPGTRTGQN